MASAPSDDVVNEDGRAVEYYFASDASAVIEHTKRVLFLEDKDFAWVKVCVCVFLKKGMYSRAYGCRQNGDLTIHRVTRGKSDALTRQVETLEMEMQEIMKGKFMHFMQKEIFEQPGIMMMMLGDGGDNDETRCCVVVSDFPVYRIDRQHYAWPHSV